MPYLHAPVVTRQARNRLTKHVWLFEDTPTGLKLSWYGYQRRANANSCWDTIRAWESSGHRYGDSQWLEASEVPWPEDLEQQVKTELMAELTIAGPVGPEEV